MGIDAGPEKDIGGFRNANATMDVWYYEAEQDTNWKTAEINKVGEIARKEGTGNEVVVVGARDGNKRRGIEEVLSEDY